MITVLPKAKGVTVFLSMEATLRLEEVNVHAPGDVDLGETKFRLATLSFIIEISPKVPRTGAIVRTANRMTAVALFQLGVPDWVAEIRADPPLWNVTLLSTTEATPGLLEV